MVFQIDVDPKHRIHKQIKQVWWTNSKGPARPLARHLQHLRPCSLPSRCCLLMSRKIPGLVAQSGVPWRWKWNFRSLKETNFTAYLDFLICANNYPTTTIQQQQSSTTTTTTTTTTFLQRCIPTPKLRIISSVKSPVLVSQSHSIAEAPALCLLWRTYPTFGKKEIHLSKVPLKWEMFVPLQIPYITKHFRYLKWRYSLIQAVCKVYVKGKGSVPPF